jgi:Na+-translocating ferredoxin:NAD+ oxidoreductase RNF subunit RnfB
MILTTAFAIGSMGLACGAALALAARFLAIKQDPRVEQAVEILPGVNCGGCGYAGCTEYARAVVVEGEDIRLCAPGAADVINKLAALLEMDADVSERKVAVVMCGGDSSHAPRRFAYNGVSDCRAAHALNGGDKTCRYGCLGYGSCARACPTGAIQINAANLAVVHPILCISCGACVRTCPRSLIRLVPISRTIHVLCSSGDKGAAVKKACKVGCIGCAKCTKVVQHEAITMQGSLAVVDYSKELTNEHVIEECPAHTIVKRTLL